METFCNTYKELTAATGMSDKMLRSIRRFSLGHPDCPFIGRCGGYPSELHKWVKNHRDFMPASLAVRSMPSNRPQDPQRAASGRPDARGARNGRRIASPAAPILRLSQVG